MHTHRYETIIMRIVCRWGLRALSYFWATWHPYDQLTLHTRYTLNCNPPAITHRWIKKQKKLTPSKTSKWWGSKKKGYGVDILCPSLIRIFPSLTSLDWNAFKWSLQWTTYHKIVHTVSTLEPTKHEGIDQGVMGWCDDVDILHLQIALRTFHPSHTPR